MKNEFRLLSFNYLMVFFGFFYSVWYELEFYKLILKR